MTKTNIDTIIKTLCPNDEDFEKPIISPAYLKKELEALALEQEPCEDAVLDTLKEKILQLDYDLDYIDYDCDDMAQTEEVHMICREEVLQIIDKYKAESEE